MPRTFRCLKILACLSVPSRLLLKAGRDYLPAMLRESRQQKSTSETQLRQRLTAARGLIGDVSLATGIVQDDENTASIQKVMLMDDSMLGGP